MTARAAALVLLVAAGALLIGVALPLRTQAATAEGERRRAQEQSERSRARLTDLERRLGALAAVEGTNDPGSLRRSVVASLQGRSVSQVRINVEPAKPPLSATLKLSVDGSFGDVVALSGRLARPGTGVVFARFALAPRSSGVHMEVDGLGLGARP